MPNQSKGAYANTTPSSDPAHASGPPRIVINPPDDRPSSRSPPSTKPAMSDRRSDKHRDSKSSSSKSSSKSSSSTSSSSQKPPKDDWSEVNEPDERRRIQNRLAQRKFREKAKDQKESRDRDAENQRHAGFAYTSPEPDDLRGDYELSGLPWGGPSMRHIVERGKAKEREGSRASPQGEREYSYYDYAAGGSGRGSESR